MKPSLLIKNQSEKTFTGQALADLLVAVLEKGVPFRFRAKGFSMSPMIRDGDVITVYPSDEKKFRVGDVVAVFYAAYEKLVVHRLIGRKNDFFMVKGDNNAEVDGLVSPDKILGKIQRIERNGKRIRLGVGKEGMLIAWLMRMGLYLPFVRNLRNIRRISAA